MRPGTTAWTCPDCGTEHGGVTMGQLERDDVATSEPAPTPAASPRSVAPPTRPAQAPVLAGGPPTRTRLAVIALIGIVVVLVAAFALSELGDGGGEATSAAPSSTLDAQQALCLHLRDLQMLREDSLARLAVTLQGDADTIEAQGAPALADKVRTLRTAILAYRVALVNKADLTDVTAEMVKAVSAVRC
jgi:hypothetical protein